MNVELIKKRKFKKFQQITTRITQKKGKTISLKEARKIYKDLKKKFGTKIIIRGLSPHRWTTLVTFNDDFVSNYMDVKEEDYNGGYGAVVKNKFNKFYELEVNILK